MLLKINLYNKNEISKIDPDIDIYSFDIFKKFQITGFFTGRKGGVSKGPFDSLNLSNSEGENPEDLAKNIEIVRSRLKIPKIEFVSQTHSDNSIIVDGLNTFSEEEGLIQADAIIVTKENIPVAVKTADCVPIILFDEKKKVAAVIHAGRVGTEKHILQKVILRLKSELGTDPEDLIMAIGPAIRKCCYEVDQASADKFRNLTSDDLVSGRMIDIVMANIIQAEKMKVRSDKIIDAKICTACNDKDFFSYRKSKITGRQITGVII